MKKSAKTILFWTPRILCILFTAFISIFAADVFEGNQGFWQTVLALLLHLIPAFLMLIILVVSWRWEWIGGTLFTGLGIFYIAWFWGRFHWSAYVIISGSLFLLGFLFILGWIYRKEIKMKNQLNENN